MPGTLGSLLLTNHPRRGWPWEDLLSALFNGASSVSADDMTLGAWGSSEVRAVSFWIKASAGQSGVIVGRTATSSPSAPRWSVYASGNVLGMRRHTALSGEETILNGSTVVCDDEWHHVVAVSAGTDATDAAIYVDGVESAYAEQYGSGLAADSPLFASNPLRLGRGWHGELPTGSGFFEGLLDEVALFKADTFDLGTDLPILYNGGAPQDLRPLLGAKLEAYFAMGDGDPDEATLVNLVSGPNMTNTDVTFVSDAP